MSCTFKVYTFGLYGVVFRSFRLLAFQEFPVGLGGGIRGLEAIRDLRVGRSDLGLQGSEFRVLAWVLKGF